MMQQLNASISSNVENGPNLNYIGLESDSIIHNVGPLGDLVISMVLLSLIIQLLKLMFECASM